MTVPTAVWPGKPQPLGATWDGAGVNVAVFSEWAERIDVCLYDVREPNKETARITLPENTRNVRHGYLVGVGPGTLYGLRADGPYDPNRGLRFNANKLLVDPYAKAIFGRVDFDAPVYPYRVGSRIRVEPYTGPRPARSARVTRRGAATTTASSPRRRAKASARAEAMPSSSSGS